MVQLEIWGPTGVELRGVEGPKVTIGRDPGNDIRLGTDARVSRLHAVLERFGAGWCVRDMGSTNGTVVNGHRIAGDRPLYGGDEIIVGTTRIVVRDDSGARGERATFGCQPPPVLTRRERDVLVVLVRPAQSGGVFVEPASTRAMAASLWVSEAAVKQHLLRLYDKFGIAGDTESRRARLANEALARGVLTLADLKPEG